MIIHLLFHLKGFLFGPVSARLEPFDLGSRNPEASI
jgi:hypothetical protein